MKKRLLQNSGVIYQYYAYKILSSTFLNNLNKKRPRRDGGASI
jgi:hypothetical protein